MTDHECIYISTHYANNFHYTMTAELDHMDAVVSPES